MKKPKGDVGGIMTTSVKISQEVCSHCGQPLVELPWGKSWPNQRIYILTCDNGNCPCYRTPVKPVTKEAKE